STKGGRLWVLGQVSHLLSDLGRPADSGYRTGRPVLLPRRRIRCLVCREVRFQRDNAPYMDPRPRDFTVGTFKCRSTPTGTLPLENDVFATIGRGIFASSMPSWKALTAQERADLLAYVKDFCPRWNAEKPQPTLEIPAEPSNTAESVTRGSKIYERMECWKCHGKDIGRASC